MTSVSLARALVRVASVVIPTGRRSEWSEEWMAELEALASARAMGVRGLPSVLGYASGAVPHAVWMTMEGWTMDSALQDLRYSARVLRRAPGFTLIAALTLALGIGANATIFSMVNSLVLRSPPGIQEPDRLVQIGRSFEDAPRWDVWSWPAMRVIAEEDRVFSGVAGYSGEVFILGRGEDTERVLGQLVTGNYFDLLGVSPHLGRLLQPSDDLESGPERVLVLSHALWTRRYGADPDVVGRTVAVGSQSYEIIGVAPAGFAGVETLGFHPEVYAPSLTNAYIGEEGAGQEWGWSWIDVVGRLRDDVTFQEAEAAMPVVSSRLRPLSENHEGILVLLAEGVGLNPADRAEATQVSLILSVIVALVLLLTCTNVANLFLSRAMGRQAEVGVRMALGAGRSRLARRLFTEASLLALIATMLALPLVYAAGDLLPLVFPYRVSVSLGADARVYAFLAGLGVVAGFLLGALPAWSASRKDVAQTLREGASTDRRSRTRIRDGMVVAQLGLSLALVTGAALLGRSVLNAHLAQPGFDADGVTAGFVDLYSTGRYERDTGQAFFRTMLDLGREIPGAKLVTLASQVPIAGGQSRASVRPLGRDDLYFEAEYNIVGPDYFETMGVPIVQGRPLGGWDDEPERVVVINQALATLFWPGEDPIGQQLQGDPSWTVVGVAGDVQSRSLRAGANPAVYYPIAHQYMPYGMALVVQSEAGYAEIAASIRGVVATIDAEVPVSRVYDMEAAVVDSMAETRTIGYLVSAFALLAVLLAAVGLYGVVSFGVAQRVRELGIRIALGAHPDSLTRLILARGLGIAFAGVVLGGIVSFGLGTALDSLLFEVSSTDPLTFSAAALVLLGSALLAAWLPARKASRVDAAISLRDS